MFGKSLDSKTTACVASEEKKTVVEQGPCDTLVVEEVGTDSESTTASPEDTKDEAQTPAEAPEPLYSIFTRRQKIATTLLVSFLAIISPLSGQIYLPALESLATSLDVSVSYINLTITTFMVSG